MRKHRLNIIRLNIVFALIEGVYVFWHYLHRPSERPSAILWGYSTVRLALLLAIGIAVLMLLISFVKSMANPVWIQKAQNILDSAMDHISSIWILFLILGLLYLILFLSDHLLGPFASYRETSRPLFVWFGMVLLQLLIGGILIRSSEVDVLREYRDLLIPTCVALALLIVLTFFIAISRIGLNPDSIYWQGAGVPVMLHQVLLAIIFSILIYVLRFGMKGLTSRKADVAIATGLWILACVLWMSQPMKPSYNSLAPAAPNYQSYPFGDALRYDLTAQEFMLGQPIPPDFFVKPLYSFLLVLFHLIGGQNFNHIILIQVALFAFIPSLTYLLIKDLGFSLGGIIAALLMILREKNAIALSNVIQVSHSRLLLSDMLVMGLMVLLAWLIVQCSRQPFGYKSISLAVGGVLGLLILARGNPVLLIPFVLCAGFLTAQKMKVFWMDFFLPFGLGLVLLMLPWLWHNDQITGRPVFQDPSSPNLVQDQLVQIYSEASGTKKTEPNIYQYLILNPLETFRFTSAHFFHNVIYSYIFLPQSFLIETVDQYARRLPFWADWRGGFSSHGWVLLPIHLSIFALGLGSAWKKNRYVALTPLILGIGYNLSVALARRSGWRFILPADWVSILFYAIGLEQLIIFSHFLFTKRVDRKNNLGQNKIVPNTHRGQFRLLVVVFLLISFGISQGHRLFSSQSIIGNEQDLSKKYQNIIPAISQPFLQEENAVLLQGRGLYPIYYDAGWGVLNYSYLHYSKKPYNRLVFNLIGDRYYGVILKTDTMPRTFPDGMNVVVIGCKTDNGYIDALAVLVESEPPVLYKREPFTSLNCPIAEP